MLDGPDDPGYKKAVSEMTESILQAGEAANWTRRERRHRRGDFPALARGISYGKGQREPMRLVGERQVMMDSLLNQDCFRRVAGFQSSAFATWYPKNHAEHLRLNAELDEKLPHLRRNFENSVYLGMTVNFGPSTWTHIHTDSKNDVRIPCAITTGGRFNHKAGGHLILWDFKLILEFPPGATILLPSALIRHSNLPVAAGETRISVTQYSAGGVRRWLEYGGRTEDEFRQQDPEGFARAWAKRRENYKEGMGLFCTLEQLKSRAV
ncbi:hypothetical protein C8J55DRAFT_430599 [Lentinula edodes]|uniref:Uncharacterized protein n=1 Tax=Lentinula lateritia TaxID=40482 RepID=A0A9W9A9L9_9AGAR|nr:hypothetical protein C8J55DRAFT_430599 [Lentinula edodes]